MCKGGQKSTTTTSSANPAAMSLYNGLLQRAQAVSETPYTPYGEQLVAPVNEQQTMGIGTINNAGDIYGNAYGIMQGAAQPLTAAQIQQYQNPYTQAVVDATQRQFNTQNEQARQQLLSQAASQGALGGNRIGVAEGQLANQQQLAQAPVIANLYNQSYQSGLAAAQQQQQAMMQGAQGIAGIGQGVIGLGGAQVGAGTLQQQTQQALDTAKYQQWQNQQAYPFQTTQWLANIGTGVGSQMGGTSSSTAPQPSTASQILGGVTSGVGMLGAAGAFGSAGWLAPMFAALARGGRVRGYASGGVVPDNVLPESDDSLLAQQKQLLRGERDVQMFPRGTKELSIPEGAARYANERGAFHYNPQTVGLAEVADASSAGRENELLDLGPYSKADILQLIQQGERPLVVIERTPDGTEVRAALGTPETIQAQAEAMAQAKSPANTIAVEDLVTVLHERSAAQEAPVGLAAGGSAYKVGAIPFADANGYIHVPEFNMARGNTIPKAPAAASAPAANPAAGLGSLKGLAGDYTNTPDPNEGSLGWANGVAIPGASGSYMMGDYVVPTFGIPKAHGGAVGLAGLDPAILQDVYGIGGGSKAVPGFDGGGAVDNYAPDFNFESQFPVRNWQPPVEETPLDITSRASTSWPEAQTVPSGDEVFLPRNKPQMYENPYKRLAQAEAEKYGIPKDIAFGLLEQESAWNPNAVSPAGAQGIAQFMPATAKGVGLNDAHDPMQAIPASMKHLRELYNQYGDWNTALAGYNASPRAVQAWRNGQAPLPLETQNYISSVRNMANIKPGFKDDTPAKPATLAQGLAPAPQEESELPRVERAAYAPEENGVTPVAYRGTPNPTTLRDTAPNGVAAPVSTYNPPARPATEPSGIDWSSSGKLWPSLVAAGFGMMASRSPNVGTAIGEGGLAGTQAYAQMREHEQQRGQNQQRIDLEAQRLKQSADIEARRAREAEWPYSRMTLQQQKSLALDKARLEAQERQQNFSLRTPFNFTDSAGRPHVFRNVPSADGKGVEQQEYDPKTRQWNPTTTAPYTGGFNEPGNNNPPPATHPNGATPAAGIVPAAMTEERALASAPSQEIRASAPPASPRARNEAYLEYLAQDRGGVEGVKYAGLIRGIADYQINPNALFSLRGNARQRALEDVLQYDPTYDQRRYNQTNRNITGWVQSPEGRATRSLSTVVEHLQTADELAKALNNGDVQLLNKLQNTFKTQFGYEGPPNFEFAKQIVADEIAKAVIGGPTAQGDREGLQRQLSAAGSPAQLAGVIKTAKELMSGQLVSLKNTYEQATGLHNFDQFLTPNAREEIGTLMEDRERKLEARQKAKQGLAPAGAVPAPSNKRVIQNGYIYEQQADGAWKPVGKAP